MDAQRVLEKLTAALEAGGFRVFSDDGQVREAVPFPGAAIAYVLHDQVELYLSNDYLEETPSTRAADAAKRAASAISDVGLQGMAAGMGVDAANTLLIGKVVVVPA